MEILNLIIITLLVPLALNQFGLTSIWLAVLIVWLLLSFIWNGLLHPLSLALVLLLLYVSVLSLAHSALRESRYIRGQLAPAAFNSIMRGTLLRWLVFPVIALLGYVSYLAIEQMIDRIINDTLYSLSFTQGESREKASYACADTHKLVCRCVAQPTPEDCPADSYAISQAGDRLVLERDIHFAIDRFFNRLKLDLKDRVKRAVAGSKSTQDTSFDALMQAMFDGPNQDILFKRKLYHLQPTLRPPECKELLAPLFNMTDCIRKEVLAPLNSFYEQSRQSLRSALLNQLHRARDISRDSGQNILLLTDDFIGQELELQREHYHQQIRYWFDTARLLDTLSFLIWLLMVLLVGLLGFFYIFCRFAYDPRHGNVALKLLPDCRHNSAITSTPLVDDVSQTDLSIPLNQQTWYVNRNRYIDLDSREDFHFPQKRQLLFRRFPNRLWLRRYSRDSGSSEIGMNFVGGGTQVVRLTLQENDRVVFVLSNLIGFTESIALATHFSWKLAYLLNRSPFFCCARGPGELLMSSKWQNTPLRAANASRSHRQKENHGRANPRDIALLDLHGHYTLNMSQSILNIFWDDHSVESLEHSIIFRDRQRNTRKANKVAGFMRKMLLVPLPVLTGVFSIPALFALAIYLTKL